MASPVLTKNRLRLATSGPRRSMVVPTRVPRVARPRSSIGWQKASGFMAGLLQTNGKSYRHAHDYVPCYGTWTDIEAFWAGYRSAQARGLLRDNPHREGTKAYESYIDGFAFGLAKFPQASPFRLDRRSDR